MKCPTKLSVLTAFAVIGFVSGCGTDDIEAPGGGESPAVSDASGQVSYRNCADVALAPQVSGSTIKGAITARCYPLGSTAGTTMHVWIEECSPTKTSCSKLDGAASYIFNDSRWYYAYSGYTAKRAAHCYRTYTEIGVNWAHQYGPWLCIS